MSDTTEATTERIHWMDVVIQQRFLADTTRAYVNSVGYHPDFKGSLVYMGSAGHPIALVHDPAIGWDGSGTVLVEARP